MNLDATRPRLLPSRHPLWNATGLGMAMTSWTFGEGKRPLTDRRWIGVAFYLTALVFSASGCTTWKAADQSLPKLPQARMSRDSVGLEIAPITLPRESAEILDQLSQSLDEQIMPAGRRRQLAAQGFRCGLFGAQLPQAIRKLLDEAAEANRLPTLETMQNSRGRQRFVQCREGRRYEVAISPRLAEITAPDNDDPSGRPTTYADALCLFALRCSPRGSQGAVIELTPEIEHGPLRQKWIAEDGSFRVQAEREHQVFDDLKMQISLRPGETVLVTGTSGGVGLGGRFFGNGPEQRQQMVLIRLAQTQFDELFRRDAGARLTTED